VAQLSASLFSGLLPGLGALPAKEGGFQRWIISGSYRPRSITSSLVIVFEDVAAAEFVPFANYDFERFALAAKESCSIALLEHNEHHLAGWPLLKLYYSSFFGAHAIMRSRGSGVVKLDRKHSLHLNQILQTYDPNSPQLSPGMYYYTTTQGTPLRAGQVSLTMKPADSGAGVHENFRKLFCDFLQNEATKAANQGAADSNLFVAGAIELSEAILNGASGGGVWLSAIRNEINYQHKHDTWFPLRKKSQSLEALSGTVCADSATIRLDGSKEKEPIFVFVNVAKCIANLSVEVGNFVAKRSTVGGAFGQKWRRLQEQIG
jgi:hypothetical protein